MTNDGKDGSDMASIGNDPGGRRRILFVDIDSKRRTIRLGKMAKRQAEAIKVRVEHLVAAKISGTAPAMQMNGGSIWLTRASLKALYESDVTTQSSFSGPLPERN
jgi:hypothetical protein